MTTSITTLSATSLNLASFPREAQTSRSLMAFKSFSALYLCLPIPASLASSRESHLSTLSSMRPHKLRLVTMSPSSTKPKPYVKSALLVTTNNVNILALFCAFSCLLYLSTSPWYWGDWGVGEYLWETAPSELYMLPWYPMWVPIFLLNFYWFYRRPYASTNRSIYIPRGL